MPSFICKYGQVESALFICGKILICFIYLYLFAIFANIFDLAAALDDKIDVGRVLNSGQSSGP